VKVDNIEEKSVHYTQVIKVNVDDGVDDGDDDDDDGSTNDSGGGGTWMGGVSNDIYINVVIGDKSKHAGGQYKSFCQSVIMQNFYNLLYIYLST